jgi:hypothetical protein
MMPTVSGAHPSQVDVVADRATDATAVDSQVVDHEIRNAVRRHTRTDRAERAERGERRPDSDQHDRRHAEHEREEVVELEPASGRSVMARVPSVTAAVHHHSVEQRREGLHHGERTDGQDHAHAATLRARCRNTRSTRARL